MNTMNAATESVEKPFRVSEGRVPRHHTKAFRSLEGLSRLPGTLLRNVDVDKNGCWTWTLAVRPNGYVQTAVKFGSEWVRVFIHQISYRVYVGPLDPALELDHLCFNRACYNPAHLEQVTGEENRRRMLAHRLRTSDGKTFNTVCVHSNHKKTCRECMDDLSSASTHRRAKLDVRWALEFSDALETEDYLIETRSDNVREIPVDPYNILEQRSLWVKPDKLCRACETVKPVSDFYAVPDYSAVGITTYPSARCKPCHNRSRGASRKIQRARRAGLES
jgi:hypothetical protein